MRVIAGRARGQRILCPKGIATRPTSDRVRESLFSIIDPCVNGSQVLDLFAGSGSLGIEALSRGAQFCVFVEKDRAACRGITANLKALDMERESAVVCKDAVLTVEKNHQSISAHAPYDLVFADPPYELVVAERLLSAPSFGRLLSGGALLILEHAAHADLPSEAPGFQKIRQQRYGDTAISFYHFDAEG